MKKTPPSTDFCIVGGGLVGALMALLLHQRGYTVQLIERKKAARPKQESPLDTRALALNYGTVKLLQAWGFADLLTEAQFIHKIHVSDKGHPGMVHIDANAQKLPFLGAVIPFEQLAFSLQEKVLKQKSIQFIEGELNDLSESQAKILIGADGADSSIRKLLGIAIETHDYQTAALIGKVRVKKAVSDSAFERFTSEGPIALLPAGECLYTLVWVQTRRPDNAEHSSGPNFLKNLQQAFGYRAGIFTEHGVMKTYPLKRTLATETYRDHVGLLGNAAHALHPVAGQGFNLAIRDILTFLEVLDMQKNLDASLWSSYQQRAQFQQNLVKGITHSFVKTFETTSPLLTIPRNILLSLFEVSHLAQRELNDVMVGRY